MHPGALPPWLGRALRHPVASAAAMTLGIRVGQEVSRFRRGEIDREELEKRAGQHIGGLGGTLAGASLGWTLGRIYPGVGSIVGAFAGGLVGHMGGERVGRAGVERVARVVMGDAPEASDAEAAPPADAAEAPLEDPEHEPVPADEDDEPTASPR